MIEPLVLHDAAGGRRVAVGEDEKRRAIERRAGDAVHDRRHTRAQRGQARAGPAGDLGLRNRGHRSGSLRGGEHEGHPRAPGRGNHVEIAAAARHAEDESDAGFVQMVNDEIGD